MKRFIILTPLVMLVFSLYAKKVEIENAKTVAKNHYVIQYEQIIGKTPEIPLILDITVLSKENETVIYIFNFEKGFTIVSADDAVVPILGYSFDGKYNEKNRPPALVDLIEHYKDQINYAIKNQVKSSDEILSLWSFYTNPDNLKDSECEIWPKYFFINSLLTTTWNQNCYYNDKCPYDIQSPPGFCDHVPAGCTAVAMAQIMKYWNYPVNGTGSHWYYDGSDQPEAYGFQFADFGTTTYNWAAMPNTLYYYNNAVSTLIYHCGVSVDTDYGYGGSVGWIEDGVDAFIDYFNYSSTASYKLKSDFSDSDWESLLRSNLTYKQPILYAGQRTSAHAFVLDGYAKMQTEYCTYYATFHVNWGWGGYYNGYFYLSDLTPGDHNYNSLQRAFVGITPPNLTYDPPPQPYYISEPACYPHCRLVEVEYFVPTVYEATSYEWDITGIRSAGVTWNGRYASVWSHYDGSGTLWCRALNHGVPGPWQTKTIYIEDCYKSSGSITNENNVNKSTEFLVNTEENILHDVIRIYPNPAKGVINISLPDSGKYSVIELINNQGEVVKLVNINNSNIAISTSNVTPGLYVVKLSSSNSIRLEKVIISK